uniref:Uncharacterized protein n=1 Tax=Cucumis melo TaxID=3656 RepID=A0A9I9E851_CUCME
MPFLSFPSNANIHLLSSNPHTMLLHFLQTPSTIGLKNSTLNLICKCLQPSSFDIRVPNSILSHQRIFAFHRPFKDPMGYPFAMLLAFRWQCFVKLVFLHFHSYIKKNVVNFNLKLPRKDDFDSEDQTKEVLGLKEMRRLLTGATTEATNNMRVVMNTKIYKIGKMGQQSHTPVNESTACWYKNMYVYSIIVQALYQQLYKHYKVCDIIQRKNLIRRKKLQSLEVWLTSKINGVLHYEDDKGRREERFTILTSRVGVKMKLDLKSIGLCSSIFTISKLIISLLIPSIFIEEDFIGNKLRDDECKAHCYAAKKSLGEKTRRLGIRRPGEANLVFVSRLSLRIKCAKFCKCVLNLRKMNTESCLRV